MSRRVVDVKSRMEDPDPDGTVPFNVSRVIRPRVRDLDKGIRSPGSVHRTSPPSPSDLECTDVSLGLKQWMIVALTLSLKWNKSMDILFVLL